MTSGSTTSHLAEDFLLIVSAVAIAKTETTPSTSRMEAISGMRLLLLSENEPDEKVFPFRLPAMSSKPFGGAATRIKKEDGLGVLSMPDITAIWHRVAGIRSDFGTGGVAMVHPLFRHSLRENENDVLSTMPRLHSAVLVLVWIASAEGTYHPCKMVGSDTMQKSRNHAARFLCSDNKGHSPIVSSYGVL